MDPFLVDQAKRGDREAFTSLAFELSDRLFAVAHRILRDFDAAGDALQVTLLHIWRDLPSLRDSSLVERWSYRILVRACHDQLRQQRRRAPPVDVLPAPETDPGPEVAVLRRDELDRAFRRLSTEQRAAIVLQYYRGLTLPEIAEILGVPAGTVRSRLYYAKRTLRAAIEADARPNQKGRLA
ncbi:MAG TPA: sigma-70 family RNA polymerase sigma factor [Candidatus Limnocylindria bacterium]|nr:sigma-70 family RNA polymerase sigma factor [Candidatus Limnocylindria bacterium]